MTAPYAIRTFGDPVLKTRCQEVTEIDGSIAQLAQDMIDTMYSARGVGLAAPQVGVQKRMFVYDDGDGGGPHVLINPVISETSGDWTFEEGCLSVPGLSFSITRPNNVTLSGLDLDGNEVHFQTKEYLGRIFQHELDHLDGVLLLQRLDPEQRKSAMRALREQSMKS